MSKFNVGDYIGVKQEFNETIMSNDWTFMTGEVYVVKGYKGNFVLCTLVKTISCNDNHRLRHTFSIPIGIMEKTKEIKEDDLVRYMVYGTGCDNKSNILKTEDKLKEVLKMIVYDKAWTGRLIGYKLIPIYEAELTTKLKVFKKPVIKRVRK